MALTEKFKNMSKGRRIFIIISSVLGVIASIGVILVAITFSYPVNNFDTIRFIGFILVIPFLLLLAGVIVSYARI